MIFIANVGLNAQLFNDLFDFLTITQLWPILTHDPSDDLHERFWDIWIFLQDFDVDFDSALSEHVSVFLLIVLTNTCDELVCQVLSDEVTAQLKNFVHCSYVPIFVRSEFFAQLVNFNHQIFSCGRFDWSCFQIG